MTRFYRWWACDFSPLDGRLRFAVYGLLLAVGYSSLLDATLTRVAWCPPPMFAPPGMVQLVDLAGLNQSDLHKLLLLVKAPLVIVWACAALGLAGRLPLMLTGLGVALFWGSYQSVAGTGHAWHAPMFLLLVCGFFVRPDSWSLDSVIASRFPAWPFAPGNYRGPDLSAFARKLVLLLVMYTLFAGGIAKLWHGGVTWLDGSSLLFYLQHLHEPKTWFGHRLLWFLLERPSAVMVLSVWTVALELASIATLFYARLRWPFVLNAWVFHLGIWFLMLPRYWPQMICYLLLVPWEALRGCDAKALLQVLSGWKKPPPVPAEPLPSRLTQIAVSTLASVVCLTLLGTIVAQREWFPLTHVPMYSCNVSSERIGGFPRADYGNLAALSRIAAAADNDAQPWWIKFEIAPKISLACGTGDDGSLADAQDFPGPVVEKFLWTRRISYALLDDLRTGSDPPGAVKFRNSQRMLEAVAERIFARPEWSQFDRFSLVFTENDRSRRVIATIMRPD